MEIHVFRDIVSTGRYFQNFGEMYSVNEQAFDCFILAFPETSVTVKATGSSTVTDMALS